MNFRTWFILWSKYFPNSIIVNFRKLCPSYGLDKIKSERDNNLVKQSLEKITNAAKNKNKNENLLSLFVEAMRNRATVGETSFALEKVYTRYETKQSIVTEVYANTFDDQNELKKIFKIGLGFSYQEIKKIPINKYDKKLDLIITEKKIIQWEFYF